MTIPGLTPEQHEARKFKLTGSTIASFLGYSPYRSPVEEWRIAMGIDTFTETDDTVAGNVFEDGILTMALRKLNIPDDLAERTVDSLFHVKHPDAIVVHPDCLIPADDSGIQAKNHNPFVQKTYKGRPGDTGSEWDNELVPRLYNMQCQLEIEVMRSNGWDVKHWYLASHFGGSNCRVYKIMPESKLIRGMLEVGLEFWRRHLDPNGPQEQPTNRYWIGPNKKPSPTPKLTPMELSVVDPPFGPGVDEPPLYTIPFAPLEN